MGLEDPDGNAVVSIAAYEVGGENALIYEYADGSYRGGAFDGSRLETGVCKSLYEVKRQIALGLLGTHNSDGGFI